MNPILDINIFLCIEKDWASNTIEGDLGWTTYPQLRSGKDAKKMICKTISYFV